MLNCPFWDSSIDRWLAGWKSPFLLMTILLTCVPIVYHLSCPVTWPDHGTKVVRWFLQYAVWFRPSPLDGYGEAFVVAVLLMCMNLQYSQSFLKEWFPPDLEKKFNLCEYCSAEGGCLQCRRCPKFVVLDLGPKLSDAVVAWDNRQNAKCIPGDEDGKVFLPGSFSPFGWSPIDKIVIWRPMRPFWWLTPF